MKTQITDTLKTAMKARDMDTVGVLRGLQAAIKQIEIDKQIELDDAGVLDVIQKQIKQRHESIKVYEENNREDLAVRERTELDILQKFMPEPLGEAEVIGLIDAEIQAQGATSMKDMGKVMAALKAKTAGRADAGMISKLVREKLS